MNKADAMKPDSAEFQLRPLRQVTPAPSLRLPVTPGNRAALRRLRAAELAAGIEPRAVARQAHRQNNSRTGPAPLFRPNATWL